jgi:hypothetical protein
VKIVRAKGDTAHGGNDPESVDMGECSAMAWALFRSMNGESDGTHILAYRRPIGIRTTNMEQRWCIGSMILSNPASTPA